MTSARRTVALIVDLARPHKASLLIVLAAMSVETVASLAAPWPLKVVVDSLSGAQRSIDWRWLSTIAAAGIVAIALADGVASYVDSYYTEIVGQHVANDLRMRVYDHLECLSFSYYDTHETGALLSTITDDVATAQDFVSTTTLSIAVDVMTIVGMLGLMFWLNWRFTLFVSGVAPILLLFVARFRRAVKRATREVRRRESDIVSVVQSGLESIRTVQAFDAREVEVARLRDASHATVDAALFARRVKSLLSPGIELVVAACTALVLWRGAALTVAGAMTLGSLIIFLAYLGKFFKPVQELAKMTSTIAQTNVALERIQSILDIEISIRERPDAREPDGFRGSVVFEHVAFSYTADAAVLRDLSFAIAPGQFVGIVGATGSGKSTIASLIPRFYDPTAGRILIDGADVRELTLRGMRRQIGFVLQDTALFRGTIRDNIAYGRHRASNAEIEAAARLANAHEFIMDMPGGYEAPIGERGVTLSGGQRQRIGIARAFIRNTPILVLDEPTASLDAEAEHLVFEGLQRLARGRTVIMIAHRLHTLRNADTILVLDRGTIAEQGTHDQLLALGGIYAGLYATQTGAEVAWHAH
ncbi:MAG TPA: ABC transporter ATP-binding protein [Vicinamibacterales bacterium]|nr:ABC transporter ATP-binding protein [Vicinamibacterales bacterium]